MSTGTVTISIEKYTSLVKIASNVDCLRRYIEKEKASAHVIVDPDMVETILDMCIPDQTRGCEKCSLE